MIEEHKMCDKVSDQVLQEFAKLASSRNFITFTEINKLLGLTVSEVISIKGDLEDYLNRDNRKIRLVSRIDLNPSGLEIES